MLQMKFRTFTGSIYEVDTAAKRIIRLSGTKPPTDRQTDDWRPYRSISRIAPGETVVIVWPDGTPLLEGSPEGSLPLTETSGVVEVFE